MHKSVKNDLLTSTGLKVLSFNEEGDELYAADEVFPDMAPGQYLRGLRTREDLTQEALAERLGVPPVKIEEFEAGRSVIGKIMAKRLAKVLNASSYEIFL